MNRLVTYGVCLCLVGTARLTGQSDVQKVERTDEKELKVKVEFAAGSLRLQRASEDVLCRLTRSVPGTEKSARLEYQKSGTTGFLRVGWLEESSIHFADFDEQQWQFELTDKIPLSLNIELGASKSDFDFNNLRIKDLTLTLGASKSNVSFSSQNRDRINKLRIEAGVSKLNASGLCNANFDRLEFEGGVGSYVLDFSGYLSDYSRAHVEVGVGRVLILLPKNLPVKIQIEDTFFSSVTLQEGHFDRRIGRSYASQNYDESKPFLDLRVNAGIGKVTVEVIE